LALALWALFGITAVVIRVLIHLRQTGTTGVLGIGGSVGSAEWLAGVGFVASIALGVAAPLLDQADVVDPIDALDGVAADVTGIALYGLGLAGVLWSQLALGRSWRIGVAEDERTALVTGGPFQVVRNPIYTAMMSVLVGLALLVPSVVSLAAVALMVIALEMQTRLVEEPYLLRSHGEEYASYAGRVGRFLPGVGTLKRSPAGPAAPERRPVP
jgi:protein-S-isoprenylcysteine O-methyltransferase Ste14